jgi:tRNA A-37 threonylcarbamoyl transferase component Bud32
VVILFPLELGLALGEERLDALGRVLSAERLDDAARVLDRALAALTTAPNAVPMDRIRLLQVRATLDLRKGNWRQTERDLEQAIALARGEPRSDAELLASMMTAYAQLLRKHHQRREARLVEQSRQGETPDVDALARDHPDVAVELRELWAVAGMADAFAFPEVADPNEPTRLPLVPGSGSDPGLAHHLAIAGEFGGYELLEKIGEGGMGVVYKARQKGLGRIVALKMIQRGALASSADVARFRAEAAAAAHLEHPQIVPVYEVGEQEGQPYFSMKYIAGSTLAKKLADGPLGPRETAALLLSVCRAIAHAHQQGIIHRDLKPSNILIDAEGLPLVGDFGLAKRIDVERTGDGPPAAEALTRTGAILGTPSYMSPEQAAGSRGTVGPASDVYSLGAILYQCLTGRPPFQAASAVDVVMMVLEQDPVLPRLLNPRADADLEMIAWLLQPRGKATRTGFHPLNALLELRGLVQMPIDGRPAIGTPAAMDPDPIVMLIVSLFAASAMTDDRISFANRTLA